MVYSKKAPKTSQNIQGFLPQQLVTSVRGHVCVLSKNQASSTPLKKKHDTSSAVSCDLLQGIWNWTTCAPRRWPPGPWALVGFLLRSDESDLVPWDLLSILKLYGFVYTCWYMYTVDTLLQLYCILQYIIYILIHNMYNCIIYIDYEHRTWNLTHWPIC